MSRGTSADNSTRRRRVIIMQSDGTDPDSAASAASPPVPQESTLQRLPESDLPQSLLSEFRRACGQTVPLLLRISSSESSFRPQCVLWDRPTLLIGRGQECDLKLAHAEVSRQHAILQIVDGRVHCADLSSATGTHWPQGANSRQQGALDFGEPVSIGPYSLTIDPAPEYGSFEASESGSGDDSLPDGLFLDFREGDHPPRRWPATRDVTVIGSGACSKIKLLQGSVSKAHCAVVRAGHALWVVDLLSDDGTLVNDELVTVRRLESGDEVRIGRFAVGVHYGSPLDDESIRFSSGGSGELVKPPASAFPKAVMDLKQQATRQSGPNGGVSEQFVLDVINQLGVMQQQALQQAQQSMTQAVQAVAETYQGRIEALEQEHRSLKQQLRALPGPESSTIDVPANGPPVPVDFGPIAPLPPSMVEPEFQDLPDPEHGSFECDDPEVREQMLRDKMRMVEKELDNARTGWGKKLIELMGY